MIDNNFTHQIMFKKTDDIVRIDQTEYENVKQSLVAGHDHFFE